MSSATGGEFHPSSLMPGPGTARAQAGSSSATPTTPGFRITRETTPPTSPNQGLLEETQYANYNPEGKGEWTEVPGECIASSVLERRLTSCCPIVLYHHEPEDAEFVNGWTPVSLKKKYWIPLVIFMLILAAGMEIGLSEANRTNG